MELERLTRSWSSLLEVDGVSRANGREKASKEADGCVDLHVGIVAEKKREQVELSDGSAEG